ncbi:phosphatase PAP2 family protein [Halovenus halobia]|uniref:phosphatase PAP2 family protein n=1 Tax=Halovenus halobia TaxID=3396622 RepID=UPI003F543E39
MRLEEQSRWLWEQYPEQYLEFALFVTDLGGVTTVMVLLSVLYWVLDREQSALVVSYIVAGASVVLLLKLGFALPRPEVELVAREYDQYGFPSGHAFTATVVYGGLVQVFDRYRNSVTTAAAVVLIVAIALSRVVIGVHYLADVIAGVAIGVGFLLVMNRVTDGDPVRGFAVGVALGVPAVVAAAIAGAELSLAVVSLGSALGGLAGASALDSMPSLRSRREGVALVAVGLAYLVVVSSLEETLLGIHPGLGVVLFAVLVAGIMTAPWAVGWAVPDRFAVGSS